MKTSLKEYGNCGLSEKAARIIDAFRNAKKNDCKIIIKMDPLVHGNKKIIIEKEELPYLKYLIEDCNLTINTNKTTYQLSWWDIVGIAIVF